MSTFLSIFNFYFGTYITLFLHPILYGQTMNLVLNTIGESVDNDMIRSLIPDKKEVEIINTSDMKIAHCIGCNQCWLKTPGVCAIKDDYESILKKLVRAENLWLVSDTHFGFLNHKGKRVMDRIVPLLNMTVGFRDGWMRHELRYHALNIGLLYQGDADLAMMEDWCKRTAANIGGHSLGAITLPDTFEQTLNSKLSTLNSKFSILFDTPFSRGEEGIPINGLVWMGNHEEMLQRLEEKLEKGFRCVKLKIGAIDFDQELDLIKRIRDRFSFHEVELRLDANGAFEYEEALYKLELLSQYNIHSIEQPIKQGQWAYMAELCRESPLPIALDEELIGVNDPEMKHHMLNIIKPRYIILKPSLHGGMLGCREWIQTANDLGIGSWITSALESNIGLNAIAQFASDVYGPHITMPQGLGTGQLFTDNIPMPLSIKGDCIFLDIRT